MLPSKEIFVLGRIPAGKEAIIKNEGDSRMDESSQGGAKRVYVRPSLVVYGSIAKLTQNGTGSGQDGGPVGMNKVCL